MLNIIIAFTLYIGIVSMVRRPTTSLVTLPHRSIAVLALHNWVSVQLRIQYWTSWRVTQKPTQEQRNRMCMMQHIPYYVFFSASEVRRVIQGQYHIYTCWYFHWPEIRSEVIGGGRGGDYHSLWWWDDTRSGAESEREKTFLYHTHAIIGSVIWSSACKIASIISSELRRSHPHTAHI